MKSVQQTTNNEPREENVYDVYNRMGISRGDQFSDYQSDHRSGYRGSGYGPASRLGCLPNKRYYDNPPDEASYDYEQEDDEDGGFKVKEFKSMGDEDGFATI